MRYEVERRKKEKKERNNNGRLLNHLTCNLYKKFVSFTKKKTSALGELPSCAQTSVLSSLTIFLLALIKMEIDSIRVFETALFEYSMLII